MMRVVLKIAVVSGLVAAYPAFAFAASASDEINWVVLFMGLFGGLAFFLLGMELMGNALKQSAGGKMRGILSDLTRSRMRGFAMGAFVTMIIQSVSASTVMLVTFVQSGLMSFPQTLSIILGAGVGSTVNAQLIAFNLSDYALLMIAVGFAFRLLGKTQGMKHVGDIILGFGILFYGMKLMSDAMVPLRGNEGFISVMQGLENPWLGLLVGVGFTAIIQSSGAFVGILLVLGSQGMISLEGSIPMILGANVGTCMTAIIASIGTTRDAQRVAVAHLVFKVLGVVLMIFFVDQIAFCMRIISGNMGGGVERQIANAHTFYNLAVGIIFLPFTEYIGRFIAFLMPVLPEEEELKPYTTYLDDTKIISPTIAIDLARAEIARMATTLEDMLRAVAVPFATNEPKQDKKYPQLSLVEGIRFREREVDYLEKMIGEYLIEVSRQQVAAEDHCTIYSMISIVKDMESIGDLVYRNVLPLIPKKQMLENDFSPEGKEELTIYHQKMCKQIRLLKEAFSEVDHEKATRIMTKEKKYLSLESQYRIKHLDRIMMARQESVETHEVHMELMNFMTQIIVYTSNIAKTFVGQCVFK